MTAAPGAASDFPLALAGAFGAVSFLGAFFKLRFGISLTLADVILAGFGIGGILYSLMVRTLLLELGQCRLVLWGGILCFGFYLFVAHTPPGRP
jgi:hypothetical protein